LYSALCEFQLPLMTDRKGSTPEIWNDRATHDGDRPTAAARGSHLYDYPDEPGIDGLNTAAFESSWRALVTTLNSEQRIQHVDFVRPETRRSDLDGETYEEMIKDASNTAATSVIEAPRSCRSSSS
jgi:hypothetical protein